MANQFFVLGIGGTGMRCIESLVHLCAMGMFDDTEIHLLALDTDKNNGNFARLKAVKDAYLNVKSLDPATRTANKDTFFSANLQYYEFSPNYEIKSSFKDVFDYSGTQYSDKRKTDLADLVFSSNVEEFNLRHGYRAQTHLGSMLMYHSIIEAVESQRSNDFKKFIQNLITASTSGKPRVFILGSVFGGTGASSIPIIPQAIANAANIVSKGAANVLGNAFFGSTLLTAYFNFKLPSDVERKEQKIIATSDKFALNSQAAMMFYQDDLTVQATYQKFYMMGTSGIGWNPMQRYENELKTLTGGAPQKNDSHYIELLAACAALDFYQVDENKLQENKDNKETDYQYRAIDESGKLEFQDFVGQSRAEEFAKKFGMLVVSSILCNDTDYDLIACLQNGNAKIQGYEEINVEQIKNLKSYFELFHFYINDDGSLDHLEEDGKTRTEGWLRQLYRSAGQSDNFLFNVELFKPLNRKELTKAKWNKKLYKDKGVGSNKGFSLSLIGDKFDSIKGAFIEVYEGKKDPSSSFTNRLEQTLKQLYDTLVSLYQFK